MSYYVPEKITPDIVWNNIPVRDPFSHKGTYGSVLALCGCEAYRGAAALCALGALRSGAGLVTVAAPEAVISSIASRILEATFLPLPDDAALNDAIRRSTVCAVGCGKKADDQTAEEIHRVLSLSAGTIVLDAGALTCMTGHLTELRNSCAGRLILTPHPGEAARLAGSSVRDITDAPQKSALQLAALSGAVVVLKLHHTLIATPEGELYENHTGNAGLARGGSGDILTGIISGLAAQGLSPLRSALCSVWLHGASADRCAARLSMQAMLPSDILTDLSQLFQENGL